MKIRFFCKKIKISNFARKWRFILSLENSRESPAFFIVFIMEDRKGRHKNKISIFSRKSECSPYISKVWGFGKTGEMDIGYLSNMPGEEFWKKKKLKSNWKYTPPPKKKKNKNKKARVKCGHLFSEEEKMGRVQRKWRSGEKMNSLGYTQSFPSQQHYLASVVSASWLGWMFDLEKSRNVEKSS